MVGCNQFIHSTDSQYLSKHSKHVALSQLVWQTTRKDVGAVLKPSMPRCRIPHTSCMFCPRNLLGVFYLCQRIHCNTGGHSQPTPVDL